MTRLPQITEVYLDNSATSPVFPEVLRLMEKVMQEEYGNPSSLHRRGSGAHRIMEGARQTLAGLLCVSSEEIIFTSGGTEANNLAVLGLARRHRRRGNHLITSLIEHPSVLEPFQQLENEGFHVTYLPPDERGLIDPETAAEAVTPETILASIMHINNEIGSLQPIHRLSRALKSRNPRLIFHVDAVQSFGKIPLLPGEAGVDALSLSAHKFHGPRGVGALYLRRGIKLEPLSRGGGQERGLRAGTENTPGVAGMALAARLCHEEQQQKTERLSFLKARFLAAVEQAHPQVKVNGPRNGKEAAPHILNLSFPGLKGELILHALEEAHVYISTASACHAHKKGPSHVLQALKLDQPHLEGAIRISLSLQNTLEQIDYAAAKLIRVVQELS